MIERKSRFESNDRPLVDVPALLDALGINDTRRDGRSILSRCPSHPDRNPSWSIVDDPHSPRNGLHFCFSCGFGGGPAALVKAVRACTWDEAFEYLKGAPKKEQALEVDVVVQPFTVSSRGGMQVPDGVKVRPFEEWPGGARNYLVERGITAADVVAFDLGFALEGRLAGRIVLPMKSRDDRIDSYTARDFTGQGKRYLEPQSGERANKSALFGEHLWRRLPTLIVTEGCFDAIACSHVVGQVADVCALHGSRLHPTQAVKFSRFPRVVVATDSDPAGDACALAIEEALGRYSQVDRARPPVGEDCASMGPVALRKLLGG